MDSDRDSHSPADRPFSRDGAPLQSIVQRRQNGFGGVRNIRGPRMLTIGEHPQRRIRPAIPEPRVDLARRTIGFAYDDSHPVLTYYWSPGAQRLNPGRAVPPGADDNTWSLSSAGKYPLVGTGLRRDDFDYSTSPEIEFSYRKAILPAPAFTPNTIIIPSFHFNPGVLGTYVLGVKLELLDVNDVTIRTYSYEWTATCDALLTSCSSSNSLAPTWDTTDTIEQFYGIKLTWSESGSHTGGIAATVGLRLYTPVAIPDDRDGRLGQPYPITWVTTHILPSLTKNVLSLGNVNYNSDICWADPNDHTVKFPWHYVGRRKMRGQPHFFVNWQSLMSSGTPGTALTEVDFQLVYVDAAGADLRTTDLFNDLDNFIHLGGSRGPGFQALYANEGEYSVLDPLDNSGESCGFYLKFTAVGSATANFILSLLFPMKVFWLVYDNNDGL